jgi:hypothetical protein
MSVMVKFNVSTWLGCGTQLFGQTAAKIPLKGYFVAVINISNHLS